MICAILFAPKSAGSVQSNVSQETEEIPLEQAEIKPLTPRELVDVKAKEYGVNRETMIAIINCENRYWKPDQQSLHTYKTDRPELGVKAGDRELSFGLVQIHLPSHPNITYDQAIDPEFAIEFLASNLAKGKGRMWSCYPY